MNESGYNIIIKLKYKPIHAQMKAEAVMDLFQYIPSKYREQTLFGIL